MAGITSTKKIKGQPHLLAYITPNEVKKLKALGGQETMTPEGIPAYPEFDNYTESSLAGTSSAGSGLSRSEFESGAYAGTGSAGDGVIQQYNRTHHPPVIIPKKKPPVIVPKDDTNPFKKAFDYSTNLFGKTWYNRVPNNPKTELGFLNNLYNNNKKAYDALPQSLKDRYEETIDPANEFSSYKDFDKFSYDEFKALQNIGDKDFAKYAADMGSPGLLYSGNVGNLEKYVKEYSIHPVTGKKIPKTYGYREVSSGEGQTREWQRLGYPSYEAYLAAMNRGGGGGGGGEDIDEVEEENQYTYRMTDANSQVPYALYGEAGYPESVTFQSYLANGGRVPRAFGGIMDTATGRKAYGLGSIFKSVGKAVSGVAKAAGKVLKSDFGKAALIGLGGYYLGGGQMFGLRPSAPGFSFGRLGSSLFMKPGSETFSFGNLDPLKMAGLITLGGAAMGPAKQDTMPDGSDRGGRLLDSKGNEALPSDLRKEVIEAYESGDDEKIKAIQDYYNFLPGQNAVRLPSIEPYLPYPNYATGGRVAAQEGGLMDLGGMEKDYRNEGGFVPIGREEKADDVPARLSVNEFVFTADAVRNAGGGDVDKGAEVMENMMKNLENGGRISEESQGNTGAQEMFSVSERIGEVI